MKVLKAEVPGIALTVVGHFVGVDKMPRWCEVSEGQAG